MKNLFLVFFLFASVAFSQSAVGLIPWVFPQFLDGNGKPIANGKVCTYAAGTTGPLATYTDSTGLTPNTNPVILDASGYASIWLKAQPYKITLLTPGTDNSCSTGTLIRTVDNVNSQFAGSTSVSVTDYNYTPQKPGGILSAGIPTAITMAPCPVGVSGTDTNLHLYISGGSGTAEAVAVTGGSCTSGLGTGTLQFTPANSHTGAWSVSSATAGVYEAIIGNPWKAIHVPEGRYVFHSCMALPPTVSTSLTGDGYDPNAVNGTILDFSNVTSGCNAISITQPTGPNTNGMPYYFKNFMLLGSNANDSSGDGFYFNNVVRATLDGVSVYGFAGNGVELLNAFEIYLINKTQVVYCGKWGFLSNGVSQEEMLQTAYINHNSRKNGFGNVAFNFGFGSAPLVSTVLIQNSDIEGAGDTPYPSVTITTAYGLYSQWVNGITLIGNYFQFNIGPQEVFYTNDTSISEIGNWFSDGDLVYSSSVGQVTGFGNSFFGSTAFRLFQSTDFKNYTVSQETYLGGAGNQLLVGTAPFGNAPINAAVNMSNQSASIAPTQILCGGNVCAAGQYRINIYLSVTTVGTAGTVGTTVAWNDGVNNIQCNNGVNGGPANISLTGPNASSGACLMEIDGVSAHGPNFSTTVSGATGSPKYLVNYTLERLR